MTAISEFLILEITLAVIGVIIVPFVAHLWKSNAAMASRLQRMEDQIEHLNSAETRAETVHSRMEGKLDDMCTRLARMEGSSK